MVPAVIKFVRQQEVPADVTLAVPLPIAAERVIKPLRPELAVLAIRSNIASFSRVISYRPARDKRSQSLKKDFA